MMPVDKLEAAIEAYNAVRQWDGGPETILCQMLADLRFYADLHALDFAEVDRQAYVLYLEDKHLP